jgi:hypothetical protein
MDSLPHDLRANLQACMHVVTNLAQCGHILSDGGDHGVGQNVSADTPIERMQSPLLPLAYVL